MSLQKIPATIITGFLGAGKTTLIRHMLENAGGRRIALIINEFGDVGVDGEVLKGCGDAVCKEEDVIELANGCICCTVADDFVPTMAKLLNRGTPFDHIVIETSGLALPQPLVRAFSWPEISSRVTVDGVVTVVDAKAIADGRFADDEATIQAMRKADPNLEHENPIEELFDDQLNCADMVILNKTDLLDSEETLDVTSNIEGQVRQGTRILLSEHGKLDIKVLLGLGSASENDMGSRLSTHEQEGNEQHDHDDFISFTVDLPEVKNRDALLKRITEVIANSTILRLKGFAHVAGSSSRLLIQAVGPRMNSYFDRPWKADEARTTKLVVIGVKGMDQQAVTAALLG
jgi:cobalamin biosynthesis protein CobW